MKRSYHYKSTLLFISLAMSLSILFGFSMARNVSIETPIRIVDFTSMTSEQLLAWSIENDIKIVEEGVYNDDVETGKVISQNVIVGERLFAGSTVIVTVSKGPDPEVMVNLIDFTGKDIGEIQQFIETNRLLASTVEFEKSTEISSAYFIRVDTTATTVKRGQPLKFFISTGSKDELTTVLVPDFTTYTRQEISTWAQTNNIKANFVDEFNNDLAVGKVISQSQDANTQVYDGSSITVKLSLGAGVVLENLVGKSKTTIDKFISDNGLKVVYSYTYSSSQNKDNGISMSPTAATKVGNGSTVNVTLSLGKISVTDFKGKTLASLNAWINEVNKQGANLKATSTTEYSESTTSGLIITQTPSSGDINPGTTIKTTVSKGSGVTVGSFVGTSNTSQTGLKVSTSKTYHATVPSGQVISQSISAGSKVDTNTSISLVISLGRVEIGSYSSLDALQSWKNSVNGSGANISVSTSEIWNGASKGSLISHSPANTSINPGSNVSAVISKGPSVVVPTYTSCSDVAGLTENCVQEENAAAVGTVLGQSIGAGSEVAYGSSITIRISKGIPTFVLPHVGGLVGGSTSYDQSVSKIRSSLPCATGLSFSRVSAGVGAGLVVSQSVAGGTTVACNASISITISDN